MLMRKLLLLLSISSLAVLAFAQNEFFAYGPNFDELETGYAFDVVTSAGKVITSAKAVVEIDPDNPANKVLHVTTADSAGYVNMATPGNMSAVTMNNRYSLLKISIRSAVAYAKEDVCLFGLYYGNKRAYVDSKSKPSVFNANEWTDCSYSPLDLERSSIRKEMQLGLAMQNADYYIDDICFMAGEDAFAKWELHKQKVERDSILQADLKRRDSIAKALEMAYSKMSPEIDKNMDRILMSDFESFEVGTEFPLYPKKGDTPIEGGKAVVEVDPNDATNKILHITTQGTSGYMEIENPCLNGASTPARAVALLSAANELNVSILLNDDVSASMPLDVIWGGYYAHKEASNTALSSSRWTNGTYNLELERSTISTKMRIGLRSENADYYLDNIAFNLTEYSLDRKESTVRYWADMMGKYFGTCVNPGISTGDTFGKTVAKNFNAVVLENAMKFDATEPGRNSFNWNADGVVNFAIQNNMMVRGHTLTWHGQNPDWVAEAINAKSGKARREEAIKILKNHIYTVVGHWKGKVAEWDVVNECLEENQGRAVGAGYDTRTWSVWYTGFGGEDYIDSAFVWAHQADPNAKLYINDYNIGHWGGGHYENGKTHAMYNLAKRLKDAGIPIDGVGMQMHTSVSGLQPAQIEETVKQFRAIGLNCIITEMDMPGGQVQDKTVIRPISKEELATQAVKYAQIADIMAKYDNAPTFMVWGVVDNRSWLDGSEGTKPLLFFEDYSPHPAYIDVRKAYQKRATVMTDVPSVPMNEEEMIWYNPEPQSMDMVVYDIVGRKVKTIQSMDELSELPDGLYIIGGKKYMVRQ